MITEPVDVLLVGLTDGEAATILDDDGFTATSVRTLDEVHDTTNAGAVVLALEGDGPLDALRRARTLAPDAAIVVVSDDAHAADATVALHAGAEDQLPRDATLPTLLPRAVRYAVGMRRVRRELATTDEATDLPNLRGFAAIAEHHVRMADRLNEPVVFVFVRLEDHDRILREEGPDVADTLASDAAEVILEAVRDADLPARIAPDTICVLLTGQPPTAPIASSCPGSSRRSRPTTPGATRRARARPRRRHRAPRARLRHDARRHLERGRPRPHQQPRGLTPAPPGTPDVATLSARTPRVWNVTGAPIVLVPGFWLGAWAWDDVATALRADGHDVTALTLPGFDSAAADRASVTLADHVEAICDAVRAAEEPVVLAVHSGAGGAGYAASDRVPDGSRRWCTSTRDRRPERSTPSSRGKNSRSRRRTRSPPRRTSTACPTSSSRPSDSAPCPNRARSFATGRRSRTMRAWTCRAR